MSDLHALLQTLGGPPPTPVLLATVVATKGSNYRKVGAHLVVFPDGRHLGLLSGGCLEEAVVEKSMGVFRSGHPLAFSLDTRLYSGCDGSLDIVVETVTDLLELAWGALQQRRPGYFLNTLKPALAAESQLTHCQAHPDPEAILSQPLTPLPRLLVVGASPDSPALVALSKAMEWQVEWICHPDQKRPSPGVQALAPRQMMERYPPDPRTAAILVNHHLGRDAAYARSLWDTPLAYLGCVGSRARREEILQRLWEQGLEPERRELYCPAGLYLGGEGPPAVALSVLAQIQKFFEDPA